MRSLNKIMSEVFKRFMRAFFTHRRRAFVAGLFFVAALLCGPHAGEAFAQNRWDDTVVIKRAPAPPTRRPGPGPRPLRRPATQRVALLTLQWRLLKFTDDGLRKVVSVDDTFSPQDRLVLSVKANQNGYLYIIRQPSADGDGRLLFPSRYYNGGSNLVRKNQEFVLPSDCADFAAPCWFSLPPSAAKETLTLIFSRDRIEELPNQAPPAGGVMTVGARIVSRLLDVSAQRLQRIPGVLTDRNTVWVRNTNAENNEEVIETLTLNGATVTKAAVVPATKN